MDQNQDLNKTTKAKSSEKKKTRRCDGFKMFLAALSLSYIAKGLGGVLMKSSLTQIERRFELSSSYAGLVDGGFEIGNLLVIVFVSYFGSKLHRPKIIGIGSLVMGIGGILIALPHFFMGHYRYSKETYTDPSENSTSSLPTCLTNQTLSFNRTSPEIVGKGCGKETGSYMWIYVLLGNMLRGIGETPIGPLGMSYIDDFAKEGHSSVYIGFLGGIGMIGPLLGFTMTSLFSKLYVDIGYVDMSTIRITPKDSRWVGAWWLGFLVSGLFSIISSIPFFFLPQNPYAQQKERKVSTSSHVLKTNEERNKTASLLKHKNNVSDNVTGFFQSLKSILTNPLYVIFLVLTLLQLSSFIGSFTYIFKYVEQQYGNTASQASFLLGTITIPTVGAGMFAGGYIIRKFKLTLVGIAKFSCFTSTMSFILYLIHFTTICESKSVAGLTLTYDGNNSVTSHIDVPLSYCNSDCNCDKSQWEPVCGNNGITYISPCLAGCKSSTGSKKSMVFHNCSCVQETGFQNRNYSAHLGECPRENACKKKFYIYMAVQVFNSFFSALGGTTYILLTVKNVQPELKSLALGFHTLIIRTLGGILAPIYFGVLVDRTCMKWSVNSCGKRGSCRIYNSTLFGKLYFGMSIILRFPALILFVIFIFAMKKKYEGKDTKPPENEKNVTDEANLESLNNNGYFVLSAGADSETCT
ncbi:solute carrier organic anion transporter family member 1B3 [Microcebus murinus]|uniref:solute carrier organic anion transporter family member 1B3 n=1 Tax=Microcebus murinus TaxID=30608 RepID=UPI003F6BE735